MRGGSCDALYRAWPLAGRQVARLRRLSLLTPSPLGEKAGMRGGSCDALYRAWPLAGRQVTRLRRAFGRLPVPEFLLFAGPSHCRSGGEWRIHACLVAHPPHHHSGAGRRRLSTDEGLVIQWRQCAVVAETRPAPGVTARKRRVRATFPEHAPTAKLAQCLPRSPRRAFTRRKITWTGLPPDNFTMVSTSAWRCAGWPACAASRGRWNPAPRRRGDRR
jgi:hypothetical protein